MPGKNINVLLIELFRCSFFRAKFLMGKLMVNIDVSPAMINRYESLGPLMILKTGKCSFVENIKPRNVYSNSEYSIG